MADRIDLEIPPDLLDQYRAGLVTVDDLCRRFGVSQTVVVRNLKVLGVDTSMRTRKRERFARHLEAAADLPPGSAYATIADLYERGFTLKQIAKRVGLNSTATWNILRRQEVPIRPPWYREVFRDRDGNMLDHRPFNEAVRALRLARGWTQARLGAACGLSQKGVSKLEHGISAVRWTTLYKLVHGLGATPAELGVTWEPAFPVQVDEADHPTAAGCDGQA